MIRLEADLQNRWNALWNRLGAAGNPGLPFAELMTSYSAPIRHHHRIPHIKDCLNDFDPVKHLSKDPDAVEMTMWTHDVVYDPTSRENEEKSAEWARRVLTEARLPKALIEKVAHLIMVSKTHEPSADDIDEQMVADIDLMVLGSHPIVYDAYWMGIRKEYQAVPFYAFRRGRMAVLDSLNKRLEKGELFHLPYFRYKAEETARYNLERELRDLQKMKVAVYAGSFDPPTNGHLHIINETSELFDNVVVAIGTNADKTGFRFPVDERLEILKEITSSMPNVDVASYPNVVLLDFATTVDARYIVWGLRNDKDYLDGAGMDEFNYGEIKKQTKPYPKITSWFCRTPDELARISSSVVMSFLKYEDWEERVKSRVPEATYKRIAEYKAKQSKSI